MKGTLYIQRNEKGQIIEKPKSMECEINLGRDGQVVAGVVGKTQLVTDPLTRARVEFISANGLFISGRVEGHHRGILTIRFQEWWFIPLITERKS